MLWALTRPFPDARTDFGAMSPLIVFTSRIFRSETGFSASMAMTVVGVRREAITIAVNFVMQRTPLL